MKIKAAAVHASPVFMDTDATIQKAISYIDEAGKESVDLVVFPEVFVPGYPYFIDLYPPLKIIGALSKYQQISVEVDGPEIRAVQEAARRNKTVVVLGISERMRQGRTCFNTQVFIDKDGSLLGIHRKLQPTLAERFVWGQGGGSTLGNFDSAVGRIGGLVCWEHTMNLARQALISDRQQIHAASWPGLSVLPGFEEVADSQKEALARVHALTAQVFVITASNPVDQTFIDWMDKHIGPQSELKTGGGYSSIIHPFNSYIAGPHYGPEEKLVVGEFDMDDLGPVKVWLDGNGHYARPEVLNLNLNKTPLWPDEGAKSASDLPETEEENEPAPVG